MCQCFVLSKFCKVLLRPSSGWKLVGSKNAKGKYTVGNWSPQHGRDSTATAQNMTEININSSRLSDSTLRR